jgi:hypothetical protein
MKTQLVVTITQTGERKLADSLLERDLRTMVKEQWETDPATKVTVRHLPEAPPTKDDPAFMNALRDAHMAGQDTGRQIGADRWNKATDYANGVVLAASKSADAE